VKFLAGLAILLSISFAVLPGRVSAGGGGQFSGVTNCFVGGRWVTVKGNCPAPSGGGASSGGGTSSGGGAGPAGALYGGFYSLGYAFGQWLVGGGSDPQEEARRRAMMEELQRRQAEAERQQREEEARRLAGIYNRLAGTLKLSGTPELRLKGAAGSSHGLKLKIGDSAGGRAGISGLPGIYLDGGDKSYGVPGLPGIYTGGPGQGSGLSASGLKLKIGEESAAAAQSAQSANAVPAPASPTAQAAPFDPASMTPQQLADIAEMFSRLPPGEQAHLIAMAQKNAAAGPSVPETAAPTVPGLSGQLPANAPSPLPQQSAASQAAASAPSLEDAADQARAGFDRPLGSVPPVRLETNRTTPSIPDPPNRGSEGGIDADAAARASYEAWVVAEAKKGTPWAIARRRENESLKADEAWTRNQKRLIEERLRTSNQYARDLYDSLATGAVPPLPPTGFSTLKPGDVILLAPDDSMLSHLIRRADNISSLENSSASHTVVFLKEVNGTKLFLDHTMGLGTRVITETEFFKEYGGRNAFKASSNWLAQPVRADEAARIWEAAKELAKKEADGRNRKTGTIVDQAGYGLYGDDNMVCSEAARWVLIKAGRDIPESSSPIKRLLGIHYGPANFFADQHSFIITPLDATGDGNR
jgi:hypothetical protein